MQSYGLFTSISFLFLYFPIQFQDVVEGAKYVVAEAYRLWLTYDERTDDISMIVIKIEDMRENEGADRPVMISRQLSSFDVSVLPFEFYTIFFFFN